MKSAGRHRDAWSGGRPPARVLLVDDHPLMRKGMLGLLNEQPDLQVCGEATGMPDAMRLAEKQSPDAVVVDLVLQQGSGLDLIRDLQGRHPKIRILVVSMYDERFYAERVLRAGAHGYVMKRDPPDTLLKGLRAVLNGEIFVSPEIANALLDTFITGPGHAAQRVGLERLSDREMQVFDCIGRGLTSREIAAQFGLSIKTVETYRGHIKRKMGLGNGNALIHAAIHWASEKAEPVVPAPAGNGPPAANPSPRYRKAGRSQT